MTITFHPAPILRSEWIKLRTLRSNAIILGLGMAVAAFTSWAVASFVTDEVLTVSEVFVYPTMLTSVFAAIASILTFTSEAQHGTLAAAIAAHPARRAIAGGKAITAVGIGLVLGVTGLAAGIAGAAAGGVEWGDSRTMATTALWALGYTTFAALIGLGVGMTVRHSAGAISGLLVWWLVVENLLSVFAPAKLARFLPFEAGYRMLGVANDFDSAEDLAVALTKSQNAIVFGAYALLAMVVGTVLLSRRDSN